MKRIMFSITFMFCVSNYANAGILLDASCKVSCAASATDFDSVWPKVDEQDLYVDYTDGATRKELEEKFKSHAKLCEQIETDFSRAYKVSYEYVTTHCYFFKH